MSGLADARRAATALLLQTTGAALPEWRPAFDGDAVTAAPDAIAPVCTDEGHERTDGSVYSCCPDPVISVDPLLVDYLVALLNADRDAQAREAAPTTVFRAEHPDSGITLGHYGTEAAARAHCEATERHSWPTGTTLAFDWIADDEDRVAELMVTAGQNEESTTGYIVTVLELDSEYDEGADE
ncbi:hypothetical protein JK361_22740 [Streptomyces sp. 5-8]|uniref:Uncharacterized protein n=1 Tax=Streptomyces musisoli TaxID=2802280 RepID=A0ABS1P4T9_9ACTN|nr:hypothetical protein [Streptomyces musisoli]MBL1107388.1 hypothetical protein [Streptomyces musisoli]